MSPPNAPAAPARLAALVALATLAGCGPAVATLEVLPADLVLGAPGASARLEAVARDAQGAAIPAPVRWTGYTPAVLSVDAQGRVTARKSGEGIVTADASGVAAEVRVRVSIPAKAALEPARLELVGLPASGTLALRLTDDAGQPAPAAATAWESSDPAVATVAGGRVTAVAPGEATVTGTSAGLRAQAAVVVRLPEFARLAVRPARLALAAGDGARLEAAAVDAAGQPVPGVPLAWSSSDPAVAAVAADGTVTALRRGAARIAVSGGDRTATVEVSVRK